MTADEAVDRLVAASAGLGPEGPQAATDNAYRRDPWAHRSASMRCKTCMWFAPKQVMITAPAGRLGRCRKHAPALGGFPAVFEQDWCGDHKLDEEKI